MVPRAGAAAVAGPRRDARGSDTGNPGSSAMEGVGLPASGRRRSRRRSRLSRGRRAGGRRGAESRWRPRWRSSSGGDGGGGLE